MKNITQSEIEHIEELARKARISVLEMFVTAGGGHFGGSLSVIELLVCLYSSVMKFDSSNPNWLERDRLILSKGHACAALCAVLSQFGFFNESLLSTFNKLDSPFEGILTRIKFPGAI